MRCHLLHTLTFDAQAAPAEAFTNDGQDGGVDEVKLHCKQLQSTDRTLGLRESWRGCMLQNLHGTQAHPTGLRGQQSCIPETQSHRDEPGADLGETQLHEP